MKKILYSQIILIICLLIDMSAFAATYYKEAGKGEPLVLIHAFPTDHRLWKPQLDALSSHFHVIVLDLKGFGSSDKTDGQAVTMTTYADQVAELLDQLHIKKAIIGGESMGGYISLAFLKKYPEKVAGLILSNTTSNADTEEGKIKRETTAADVLTNGTQALINNFMSKALTPLASDETRAYLLSILKEQTPEGIASATRGMALREDQSEILAKTTIPILILSGDKDTLLLPEQSEKMKTLAKNSQFILIANAAHLSNLEQPEIWNKAVIDFFNKK